MSRRRAERSKGGRRASKPSKRDRGATKEVIHARAYWFDRARSLCELHGWARPSPGDGRGLIGRYETAVSKPVGQLGSDELLTLLTQGTDPHFLVPIVLERLHEAEGWTERELLRCLLRLDRGFWRTHPFHRDQLLARVTRMRSTLEEHTQEADGQVEENPLVAELEYFIDRWREA